MQSEEKVVDAEFEEDRPPQTADDVTRAARERLRPSASTNVVCKVIDAVEKPLRRVSPDKADVAAGISAKIRSVGTQADEAVATAAEVHAEVQDVAAAVKEAAPQFKAAWEATKQGAKKAGEFIGKLDKMRGSGRFKRKL